jgi:hypothetical protein
MRYLFTTLLLTAVVPLFAQKPFEGKIVYEVRSKADNKKAAMTIYFGRNNMRLEFIDSATKRQEDIILINLDSATIVTLKPNKSYKTSQLKRITSKTSIDTVKSIAGYEVERIALSSSGLFGILSSVINDPVLYVAKDLFYPVPGIYKGNPELLMINRNRIVIGAEFSFPSEGQWNLKKGMEPEASDAGKVSAFAYLVQSQSLDISLFQIPIGYEKQPAYSGNDDAT